MKKLSLVTSIALAFSIILTGCSDAEIASYAAKNNIPITLEFVNSIMQASQQQNPNARGEYNMFVQGQEYKEEEKSLLILGNSYVNYGCADVLATDFAHSYKFTGGGVGFVAYTSHSDTFETLLDSAIASSSFDNNTITDILIVSAVGDGRAYDESSATYENSVATCIASMKTKIDASFVNCKNIKVTHAESRNVGSLSSLCKYSTMFILHQIFKRVFNRQGFEYIGWSGFNSLFNAGDFQEDNYHPSESGALAIGRRIRQSWYNSLEYKKLHGQGNVTAKYTATATINVEYDITPDDVSLHIRRINCTNGDAITLAKNEMLVSGADFPVPIPSPALTPTFIAPLIDVNGVLKDCLQLGLSDDGGNGIFGIQRLNAKVTTTAGSDVLYSTGFHNFTYKMY